jgi:plasmid stabilization system protein ParE
MKPLQIHHEAQAEAKGAFDRYWDRSRFAAMGFDAELRAAYESLQKSPYICPPFLHGTRRVILRRYPFSVVFRELLHEIQVVAIAHARRKPGYWAKRL